MMQISELILRLLIAYVTLLTLARLMGRKEITQMTFFNFVSGITIGTIGASLAIDSSISIRNGVIALITWSIFTILTGIGDIKSKSFRNVVQGKPVVFIQNGKILEDQLRKERLDLDALKSLLREKNVFSISEVEYAIFETSGKLTVQKKADKQTVTKEDMTIKTSNLPPLPTQTSLISEGKVHTNNLQKLGLDEAWLNQQLQTLNQNPSDIFYAELQKDGTLFISPKIN